MTLKHILLCCAVQVLDLSLTPNLETPQYTVLRVTNDYEVRRYEPFVVAEAPMGPGSSKCTQHTACRAHHVAHIMQKARVEGSPNSLASKQPGKQTGKLTHWLQLTVLLRGSHACGLSRIAL